MATIGWTDPARRPGARLAVSLAGKVADPTALISTLTFQNKYSATHWDLDDDANEFSPQAAISSHIAGPTRTESLSGCPLEKFHRNVCLPVGFTDLVNRADRRMVEGRRGSRLT